MYSNKLIFLNGSVHILYKTLDKIAASAVEAELDSLFLNTQEIIKLRLAINELRQPQPSTPLHTDSTTTNIIIHQSIKQQRYRAMEVQYFWTIDKQKDKPLMFNISQEKKF